MQRHASSTNPIGWAEKAVGTRLKFCLSMATTIVISCMLMAHYIMALVRHPMSFMHAVSYTTLVFAGAVVWPLAFVKALRALVVDRKKAEEEGAGAESSECPSPATDGVPIGHVLRGGVVDNVHRGALVIADTKGSVVSAVGDPMRRAFIRSAGKPLQALALIERGGAERYGLTPEEIAIVCASHSGGPAQVAAVRSVLAKAEIPEEALQAGSGIKDNCSGKHSGMLALAKMLGHPLESYCSRDHDIQGLILQAVSEMCGLPKEEIGVAIDGCGAPIFVMPLLNMATGYARLANPDGLTDARAEACRKIVAAMQAHPEMVGGLDLRPFTNHKIVAKSGASGCYCLGLLQRGAGFAMKVADGSSTPVHAACFEFLRRNGYVTPEEHEALLAQCSPIVRNRRNDVVGRLESVF